MNSLPTATPNRIEILDIYRGFAIFGIFVVNIVIMNSTFLNQDEFAMQWTSTLDRTVQLVLQLFFYTKFFPIFSLLFGLGISMQVVKLKDKGLLSFSFLARRMFYLLLFGAAHIVFLWSGDVLNIYAFLGLLTVVFINKSNKTILIISGLLLVFPFYDVLLEQIFNLLQFQPQQALSGYTGESVHKIISEGSYLDGLHLRLLEYVANSPMLFGFLAPIAFSMFLLGLYLGKNKIYLHLSQLIKHLKKPLILIAIISNCYRLLFLFLLTELPIYKIEFARGLFIKLMVLSDIIMGLFYLWLIGWLWFFTSWNSYLTPLRYVGRMALSNYILQSVIGVLVFSAVGLGLYETLCPSQTFGIATITFVVQIGLSKLWLSYFKYGPLEWLWRCLSYNTLLSIKK